MPFIMQCENKQCRKQSLVVLDTTNNKVYCGDCDEEITTITSFAKNQLKSLGQIKTIQRKKSHIVLCNHCKQESTPRVENKTKIICTLCNKEVTNLTEIFKKILISKLNSGSNEV